MGETNYYDHRDWSQRGATLPEAWQCFGSAPSTAGGLVKTAGGHRHGSCRGMGAVAGWEGSRAAIERTRAGPAGWSWAGVRASAGPPAGSTCGSLSSLPPCEARAESITAPPTSPIPLPLSLSRVPEAGGGAEPPRSGWA